MRTLTSRAACLIGVLLGSCVVTPPAAPSAVSSDTTVLFEQRLVYLQPASTRPGWEAWRLYESGRIVYARPGVEPIERRVEPARLLRAHAWLRQHDFELVQGKAPTQTPRAAEVSGVCQVRLSTGLNVAGITDPRYYACEELKKLCFAR